MQIPKNTEKAVKRVRVTPPKFHKLLIPRPDVLHGYLKHSEINQYLDYLANRYPTFVRVYKLGQTHEQRSVRGIEIDWCCTQNILAQAKEAKEKRLIASARPILPVTVPQQGRNMVFIEGGTHAREWISITVALNCIYQLIEKNMRNRDLLRKMRFFIVPIVNPDGYEYTRSKNRNWRKNRRPHKNSKYIGTDCNRNYDFHWDKGHSKASRNTYKGEKPFSEPETRAIRNVLHKLAPNLLFFLSLHSYAQSIMYPWGYSRDLPESWKNLETLATSGRNAIKAYNGRKYRTGSISSLTKRTINGSIVDYAYGIVKIPLVLVMELPASNLGFQPPPESISPIGHESWFGIREMCKCAYDLKPQLPSNDAVQREANEVEILQKDEGLSRNTISAVVNADGDDNGESSTILSQNLSRKISV